MTGNMAGKIAQYIMVGKMGQDTVYVLFPCYQTWQAKGMGLVSEGLLGRNWKCILKNTKDQR